MNPSPAEKPSLVDDLQQVSRRTRRDEVRELCRQAADELSRLAGELARVEGERDAARKAVRSEHSFVRQKESEIITLRDDRYVLAAECAAARVLHTTSIGVINDGWPQESLVDATATLKAARSATDASQALDRAARSLPTPPAKEQP